MPRSSNKKSAAQLDREIAESLNGRTRHSRAERAGTWRHGSEVQSLLFERPLWTPSAARKWARAHDYVSRKVHVTDNYIRLRQFPSVAGTQKRTITFGDGIKAVIEQVR